MARDCGRAHGPPVPPKCSGSWLRWRCRRRWHVVVAARCAWRLPPLLHTAVRTRVFAIGPYCPTPTGTQPLPVRCTLYAHVRARTSTVPSYYTVARAMDHSCSYYHTMYEYCISFGLAARLLDMSSTPGFAYEKKKKVKQRNDILYPAYPGQGMCVPMVTRNYG
jgi:hypothetical protein